MRLNHLYHWWRRQFGIHARKLEIRSKASWWGYAVFGALSALALMTGYYIFSRAGRTPEEANVEVLQERVRSLEERLHVSGSALTRLEITRSARLELEAELQNLSGSLASAKDDLAYFLRLVPAGTREGEVRLERFTLRPDANTNNRYHFSVLVGYHAGRQTAGFSGYLSFFLTVERQGQALQFRWPESPQTLESSALQVRTYQWERKEGILDLSPNDVLKKAEIRLMQGSTQRAAASVTL
ncbi:MAG: hypothetical protein LBG69_03555 [Zoogloeaceae bacterium]|jgi:hypothetical protein|nr:hypothetical protein [Zoogloeaceae bacterium]